MVTGRHQLAHLLADLQGVVAVLVGLVRSHPAEGAVAPVVQAAGRGVVGIEGHHRQQLHRGDAQLLEVGDGFNQAEVRALLVRAHGAAGTSAEAADMQLVDHRALPGVAGPRRGAEIKAVPFGDHPFQAAGCVGDGPHCFGPLVHVPARDGAGAGIEQQLRWVEAMAARLQRSEHPVGVAAADADAFHLHMPEIAGAVRAVQLHHLFGFRCIALGEQQQLHAGGHRGHQREIDAPCRGARPQGPGLSEADRSQRSQQAARPS